MIERISNSFTAYSSNTFLITNERQFTYTEAALFVDNLALSLITELEISPKELALVQIENSPEFVFFILALWKIGALPVPISPNLTDKETNDLISFVNPKVIIRKEEIAFPGAYYPPPSNGSGNEKKETDKAVVIFTSGTSGKPKGVVLTYENLFASYDNALTELEFNSKDKWLATLPMFHIGGFQILLRTILSGACLIIPSSNKTEDIEFALAEHDPTIVSFVAAQLNRLVDREIKPVPSLRKVMLGGGFTDDNLIVKSLELNWPIVKVYGSSETASLFTLQDCLKDPLQLNSSGKPLKGNQLEIRDDSNNVLPFNENGNIWLKGNSCSQEYFGNPEETEARFKDGWYNSGDYGYLNEQGYLFLSARRQDLIVTGGENVSPFEVENELKKILYIKDAIVFGEANEEWGHRVSAAIILKTTGTPPESFFAEDDSVKQLNSFKNIAEDNEALVNKIKKDLKENLSSFKIPKKFYFVESFPVNEMGKVNRELLKKTLGIQ